MTTTGKYDSEKYTFSQDSTKLLQEIEIRAKHKVEMTLSPKDLDRLAGILWHVGIFK